MIMAEVSDLKPSTRGRSIAIVALIVFLGVMIAASLGGAIFIALMGKFVFTLSSFLIVFVLCAFACLLGVTGSWLFAARWENSDFLKVLPDIIPHLREP